MAKFQFYIPGAVFNNLLTELESDFGAPAKTRELDYFITNHSSFTIIHSIDAGSSVLAIIDIEKLSQIPSSVQCYARSK